MMVYFKLIDRAVRLRACAAIMAAAEGWVVTIKEATRTLDQNAAQWPILQCFAAQLRWPVDGEMVLLTDQEWKDILTAVFYQDTVRLARGWNGGVVMLGRRTSGFSKSEFSEWLDFLKACAAERGVELDEVPA